MKQNKKEYWAFPLYQKNSDGSENGAEILGYKEAIRWYRSAVAIEASKKVIVKQEQK